MKRTLRRLASLPFRMLPRRARRRLLQAAFDASAAQQPNQAMSELLLLDDDLTIRINDVALSYDGGVHVKHRLMRYHDFFVDRIRAADQVLDLGCGYGAVAYSIASRTGAAVLAIDVNPEHVRQARERFHLPNLQFILGDALKDLPDRTFDVVVLSNLLEHLERRVEFLRAGQGRLEPRRWLIRVPMFNRDWRVPLRQELGLPYFSDGTHFTEYTVESFRSELAEASLEIIELQVQWGEIWAEAQPRA